MSEDDNLEKINAALAAETRRQPDYHTDELERQAVLDHITSEEIAAAMGLPEGVLGSPSEPPFTVGAPTPGTKHDLGKVPLHLIPGLFLYAIARVLKFGAAKYSERNWEQGIAWSRVKRACQGHLEDWFDRRGNDPETGMSHLWHAGCCIMFLICYEAWGMTEYDDRPPARKPVPEFDPYAEGS